jgi:hypothetical protein
MKKKLSEKIQVLLDKKDLHSINFLIFKDSYLNDSKIVSTSEYIRNLIRSHIDDKCENNLTESDKEIKKIFEILQKQKIDGRE